MKNGMEKIGEILANALDKVVAHSDGMQLNDVISIYDNIEATFLPKVSANNEVAAELKRRVAEHKFYLFSERNRPFKEVALFYEGVHRLGFADLERKATVAIIFARYCLRNNYPERGTQILKDLCNELDEALAIDDSELYRHLRGVIEELFSEINGLNP